MFEIVITENIGLGIVTVVVAIALGFAASLVSTADDSEFDWGKIFLRGLILSFGFGIGLIVLLVIVSLFTGDPFSSLHVVNITIV